MNRFLVNIPNYIDGETTDVVLRRLCDLNLSDNHEEFLASLLRSVSQGGPAPEEFNACEYYPHFRDQIIAIMDQTQTEINLRNMVEAATEENDGEMLNHVYGTIRRGFVSEEADIYDECFDGIQVNVDMLNAFFPGM